MKLEVVFIGTGDAFGSGGRRNSAILLHSGSETLLLDCGPSTLVGLKQLGLDPGEIDAIALSHFHGDHTSGVPFLLLDYMYSSRRTRPLVIHGPTGVEGRVTQLMSAYEYGWELPFPVSYREFKPGEPRAQGGFRITPFDALHHPETMPHMLRIETARRSLFFSGDTGWQEELPTQVADADLFVSECTEFADVFEYHLSHERLVRERARFRCKRMILTHLGREVLEEIDRLEFETASDGLRLEI